MSSSYISAWESIFTRLAVVLVQSGNETKDFRVVKHVELGNYMAFKIVYQDSINVPLARRHVSMRTTGAMVIPSPARAWRGR